MGKWLSINRKKVILFLSLMLLPFLFQNCSKEGGFNSVASSLSTLCLSKLQATNLVKLANYDQLNCEEAQHYSCETRFFNPDVNDSYGESQVCLDNSFCVTSKNRNFSTAKARQIANTSENEFAEGGDYNRLEANCNYFNKPNELFLLQAEAPSVEEALQKVKALCLDARARK